MNVKESEIKEILENHKKIAVYGLSSDTTKPSFTVPEYMRNHGWELVGTYPKIHSAGGFKIYNKLADVPADYRKFVDVFRSSDRIPEVVDEVLSVGGVEVLWLQLGITNTEAEKRAEAAGIKVISNRCLVIEHRKWFR
jgi:predicted CoA-binding protein